jgi:hypothetical protein
MKGILHCYEVGVCGDFCPRRIPKCSIVVLGNRFDFAEGAPVEWADYNPWTEFWLHAEREWAEHEKKQLYYDPDTCPDMNEWGCSYPDCENCQVVQDDEEEDDNW